MSTTAPASTYFLVGDLMAIFISFGTVLIFTPPWYWYMIPVALAVPFVAIMVRRWSQRQHLKAELRGG